MGKFRQFLTKLSACDMVMLGYYFFHFYTLSHNSGRVLWFHIGCPCVCPSVRHTYVSPNLVCALILWRSGLGLLMGKFRQIFTESSALDTPIFFVSG